MARVDERRDRVAEHGPVAQPADIRGEVVRAREGVFPEQFFGAEQMLDDVQPDRLVGRHRQLQHDITVRLPPVLCPPQAFGIVDHDPVQRHETRTSLRVVLEAKHLGTDSRAYMQNDVPSVLVDGVRRQNDPGRRRRYDGR